MKKYLQKILCVLMSACLFLCMGCSRQPILQKSVDTAMGTIISQSIYITDTADSALVSQEILAEIEALEQEYLSWRLESAEIYRINESAGSGKIQTMSDKLGSTLEQCRKVYAASDGAFDFTIGGVARIWDIDSWASEEMGDFVLPEENVIRQALTATGADKLYLDGKQIRLPEGMQIDLGAVGKGIAMDEIKEILAENEAVTGAVISVGGSILTYGSKPNGGSWNVAIVNPFDTAESLGSLSLKGQWCVSTSGDYERYVEVDGVRYHHILDPATGKPAESGVKSVTILTDNGLYSDALSTACFVLGVEKGLALAEDLQAEALFVNSQGEIVMTEGMEQYFVETR